MRYGDSVLKTPHTILAVMLGGTITVRTGASFAMNGPTGKGNRGTVHVNTTVLRQHTSIFYAPISPVTGLSTACRNESNLPVPVVLIHFELRARFVRRVSIALEGAFAGDVVEHV